MFLDLRGAAASPAFHYRSDLWRHLRGPRPFSLGARLFGTLGENYREAIRRYYRGLVSAGVVKIKTVSPSKAAVVLAPQYNTCGAEVARGKEWYKFHEADALDFEKGMKACGMKAKMFVFDAKWEGKYGRLRHSPERFPNFETMLARLRKEGFLIGMWAAFLRVEEPAELGLTMGHVLRQKDGKPFSRSEGDKTFYILDFTQPEVQEALRRLAGDFVRRYQPDMVKFDFGYEIPGLSVAAPKNMALAGEKVLLSGVEVVVEAMRQVKPDIAIMYYSLSPLFVEYFDLHSPDDLFLCQGDYDLEANRRFFFSSLLGELGMPTYGSGGYEWQSMPDIWFDSTPLGTLGSLLSFDGDERNQKPTPQRVAKFNGCAKALRPSVHYTVEPLDADYLGPARAARAASWARFEDGKPVLVALRSHRWDGKAAARRYRDIVATTASVIVSSKTAAPLPASPSLVIVPFGDGEVTIRRSSDATFAVRRHSFDGAVESTRISTRERVLRLSFQEQTASGVPVEYFELEASA